MAKLVISADIHFCKRESLVENRYPFLQKSIAWADAIEGTHIDLGDFFNASSLSAEDVAVLESIKFKSMWHCIAGNHEQDGSNSLLKYFRDMHFLYEKPQIKNMGKEIGWVLFLPFMKEPQSLEVYLKTLPKTEQVIVFSHCDFIGMFGAETGFKVDDIEKDPRIRMWFNGHYHQRAILGQKTVVVGNMVGKNFTQNLEEHGVCVYDMETNTYEFVENPYALCFGKMDTSQPSCKNIRKLVEGDAERRYVLAIQTDPELKDDMKKWADKYLVASRILSGVVGGTGVSLSDSTDTPLTIDHVELFYKEVVSRFGEGIANAIRQA